MALGLERVRVFVMTTTVYHNGPTEVGSADMNVSLERNNDFNEDELPYFARIEIVRATADVGRVFRVPIRIRYHGLDKTFWTTICGFELSARHPQQLPSLMVSLLRGLVNAKRLPTYVFIARRARAVFPVYTLKDEVFVVAPSGPVFRHVELAKVREYLTDYLHRVGILGDRGKSDKLHVRGIGRVDLQLRRPVFYLKKRQSGQNAFWAPVFESADGRHIYAYAANLRREVPVSDGSEVEALRAVVAEALIADSRLEASYDLRADRLMPAYWERVEGLLDPAGETTILSTHVKLYRDGANYFAMESRPDESRYGLFNGASMVELRARVQADLDRRRRD